MSLTPLYYNKNYNKRGLTMKRKFKTLCFLIIITTFIIGCEGSDETNDDNTDDGVKDKLTITFMLDGVEKTYYSENGFEFVDYGGGDTEYVLKAYEDLTLKTKMIQIEINDKIDMIGTDLLNYFGYDDDGDPNLDNDYSTDSLPNYTQDMSFEITEWGGNGGIAKGSFSGTLPRYGNISDTVVVSGDFELQINE